MNISKLRLITLSLALATSATALRADFSGDYDVGLSSYNLVDEQPIELGEWTASLIISSGGGFGTVDTSFAPDTVILSVTGFADSDTASLTFAHQFKASGPVNFGFSVTVGGSFHVALDSLTQTPTDGFYSFDVIAGQTLVVTVSATGTASIPSFSSFDPVAMIPIFIPGTEGRDVTATLTLTDFSGPVSVIPEPASAAALAGLAFLGLAACRRRARA